MLTRISATIHNAVDLLEHATGIVVPTWFPADTEVDFGVDLLGSTVQLFVREIADPRNVCISADGAGISAEIAERVAATYHTRLICSERNGGKLTSVRNGMKELLEQTDVRYLAVVDHDGDHFANELLNFVRCAEHVVENETTDRLIVLGNRLSRHHSLGFLRGEQEELANRILLDALHYAAVLHNHPLALHYATTIDDVPDFHSGYKFFSRRTAEDIFLSEAKLASCDEAAYYRHACEAVMVVEAIEQGATLATINRRTFDEQPTSTFARIERSQLAADMIIWPCKRLGVPGHFVAQWLANHMPRLLLGTLIPQGRAELLAIRRLVLRAFEIDDLEKSMGEVMKAKFI